MTRDLPLLSLYTDKLALQVLITHILEPVSINAVAIMVKLPPPSMFLAAPKNLFGFSKALASTPPVNIFPEAACVEL